MPNYKITETDKIIKKEQKTNTGIYITAGDIDHSDYDLKSWTELQEDYTHMRDGHAIISTTIDILKYPILMSEYRIESKNKECEDYVCWVLDNLLKGFDYFKRHKLLALDFGLSLHEMVVKRGEKYNKKLTNRPVWFNPVQNETINQFYYDDNTKFIGIKHEKRTPEKGSSFIDIYIDDLEFFSFNEEFNDVRGRALLRPVRFFWESELKIINARVTSIQRGAGIPIIYAHGEPSLADQASIEKIGRTICQLRNGYVSANKERVEIELMEPKGQQDAMQLLEWLDRQMFFNTLTQFMTAGIGQNGSRAATNEHKSSYELAANYVLQALETNIQQLVHRIMKMSYLAKVPQCEYPEFHFNAITQIDLQKVSGNIKTLMDSSAITKQRSDEESWRQMFGMPKLEITTEIVTPQEKPTLFEKEKNDKKILEVKEIIKEKNRNVSLEVIEFENRIFSLSSANEHYETIENQTDFFLNNKYKELFKDITFQLLKDRYKSIVIRNSLIEETADGLIELYSKGFLRGERDVKSEIKKLNNNIDTNTLAVSKKKYDRKRNIIEKLIKKLFINTKVAIENKMQSVNDKFIELKGGLPVYLTVFEEGFKTEKNNLKKTVESGYIDGRGETLLDIKDDVQTFLISTRLDKNLCNECAKFDGLIVTYEELQSLGLSLTHPVNLFCLGWDNCRCVVLVYDYGRK